ncbi:hypothetical protein [Streptomyces sp. NPDC001744]|uniref:hypothetical protein n=1 Tax=Streptomyces sp. NPDC001744 TaxID=3364606 RepID=UPI0036863708
MAPMLLYSFGRGIVFTSVFAAAAATVPTQQQGVASGTASTGQRVGSAVGLAVLVAIANSGVHDQTGEAPRSATTDGIRTAVFVAAAMAVLLVVAGRFERTPGGETAARSADTAAKEAVGARS